MQERTENIKKNKKKVSAKIGHPEEKTLTLYQLIRENQYDALVMAFNTKKTQWKSTINFLLMSACSVKEPNIKIIELLIQKGANVNYRNRNKDSITHDININLKSSKNETCLLQALASENKICKY